MDHTITSTALYFESTPGSSVPQRWFDSASAFLTHHGLSAGMFDAVGEGFQEEIAYDMRIHAGKLIDALQMKSVQVLRLYSDLVTEEGAYGWRAMVSLDMVDGLSFCGVDGSLISHPSLLIRDSFTLLRPILRIGYGIGFTQCLSEGPELYASGGALTHFEEMHALFADASHSCNVWLDELCGERRFLRGLFRGAYPASVLSQAHVSAQVRGRPLAKCIQDGFPKPLGTLTRLDDASWLWELSADDIPVAEAELREADLLIE